MLKLNFAARLLATAAIATLPALAHAGYNGDFASLSFSHNAFGTPVFSNPAQVGAGVEFSALSVDNFGHRWTLNGDVSDNGFTLFWTESTRAHEPNGGNISMSVPAEFTLSFANSTVQPLMLQSYSSQGRYSNGQARLTGIEYLNANTVKFKFNALYDTDRYVFANAVPEAQTYAMMLGGLAMLGLFSRRRKQA
ncbi:PEP-CTERM sorting domain-containing protein [Massilia sp. W12]|uniref:PEP-CTERM sorting domain-containing protein n=1 Tax=Massilia sp. W12 TaxID=3126507 RepID=UPI0030CBF6F7